jgi:hypothetical protein
MVEAATEEAEAINNYGSIAFNGKVITKAGKNH